MTTTTVTPRIYVACLAAYNNGILHGEWIDAHQDADSIRQEVQAMLAKSPEPHAEEWAIHDHEGFAGFNIHESESFETVAELAALLEEHGPAYAAYANHVGHEYASSSGFQDAYCGEWDSEEAYAENYADECMEIPEHLENYIDYEKMARDFFCGDLYSVDAGGGNVYVFHSY